ncbi:hypothetical protein BH11PSE14_BH11PSE14_15950 [soil metagenome]
MNPNNKVTGEYPHLPADAHTRMKHRDAKGRFAEGVEADCAPSPEAQPGDASKVAPDKDSARDERRDSENKQH